MNPLSCCRILGSPVNVTIPSRSSLRNASININQSLRGMQPGNLRRGPTQLTGFIHNLFVRLFRQLFFIFSEATQGTKRERGRKTSYAQIFMLINWTSPPTAIRIHGTQANPRLLRSSRNNYKRSSSPPRRRSFVMQFFDSVVGKIKKRVSNPVLTPRR